MYRYRIVLFNSFGEDKLLFYDSWLLARLKMIWLNITKHNAIWLEKGE